MITQETPRPWNQKLDFREHELLSRSCRLGHQGTGGLSRLPGGVLQQVHGNISLVHPHLGHEGSGWAWESVSNPSWFSEAAVTKDHKPGDLKQQIYCLNSGSQKSNIGVSARLGPLEDLEESPSLTAIQASGGCRQPLVFLACGQDL